MNNALSDILITYATKPHKELNALLLDKSKDDLISLFNDLLTIYINDKNSSTIREFITITLAGYTHSNKKIGYNGFKQSVSIGGEFIACEAKPRNICTGDNNNRKTPRKLDGGGNFTDYTPERLKKDLAANLNILVSGFIDGQLIYILEFPFCNEGFTSCLKLKLKKRFKNKSREKGTFLRSASFGFRDYQNCKKLKIVYINVKALKDNRSNFNGKFYNFLTEKAK
ncbi:hypothetical protein EPN28_03615 [Patescibacteria group bacterium]|nr:MAG: hypothetical protein EPN28_03615 [Patescibacteria group bacterium]